jgi:hypothetical protein
MGMEFSGMKERIKHLVRSCVGYLAENMDPIGQCVPLLEAKLELREPDLYYMPSLEPGDPDGLDQLILGLSNDIIGMAALISRLKSDSVGYAEELARDADIKGMRDEILTSVAAAVEEATDFCSNFEGTHLI